MEHAVLNIRVPPEVKKKLEQMAEAEARMLSNLVRLLLVEAIKARETKT